MGDTRPGPRLALHAATGRTNTAPGACGHPHDRTAMYVLHPDGPVLVGVFDSCAAACGDMWRCAACPCGVVPYGPRIFRHLRHQHGRQVTA